MIDTELFRVIWNALEERGMVDAWGGCECERVIAKWRDGDMSGFFCEAAWHSLKHQVRTEGRKLLEVVMIGVAEIFAVANVQPPAPRTTSVDLQQEDMLDLEKLLNKEHHRGN